jgi:hypothetical protein
LDGSCIGFVTLEDNRKKSRFSGTIRANEGNMIAVVHLHCGGVEKDAAAVGFSQISDCEHLGGLTKEAVATSSWE